jgi:hypothetical protein
MENLECDREVALRLVPIRERLRLPFLEGNSLSSLNETPRV